MEPAVPSGSLVEVQMSEESDSTPLSQLTRLMRMTTFVAVLIAGVIFNHALAAVGLPRDGRRTWLAADLAGDVLQTIQTGVVLGWLVRVEDRWDWLGSRRRGPLLLAIMLGTGPAYSAVSNQKGMGFSLSAARLSTQAWAVLGVVGVVATGVAAWQVRQAFGRLSRADWFAYAASRSAVVAALALAATAVNAQFVSGRALHELHLHHYIIAWVFASLFPFNTRNSGIFFAVAVGVFAQGIGAYGFAPFAEPAGCISLSLPSGAAESIARAAGCAWDARLVGSVIKLRVCPDSLDALAESKVMHCGHSGR